MNYFKLEIQKIWKFPLFKSSFALISLLTIVFNMFALLEKDGFTSWVMRLSDTLHINSYILNLCWILLTAQLITDEYRYKSLQLLLSQGLSRGKYISTKIAALIYNLFLVWTLIALLSLGISAIIGIIRGNFDITQLNIFAFISTFATVPLKLAPLILMTIVLTTLLRTSAASVAIMFFYVIIGELILVLLSNQAGFSNFADTLPGVIGRPLDNISLSFLHLNSTESLSILNTRHTYTPVGSVIIILIYIITFGFITNLIIKKQDLSK